MFLTWPVALFVLKTVPADIGQFPDGAAQPPKELSVKSRSFRYLLGASRSGCCCLGKAFCSIGSIGAVNFHMKFVFLDEGFKAGSQLDSIWRRSS